jgi:hypothetical protein
VQGKRLGKSLVETPWATIAECLGSRKKHLGSQNGLPRGSLARAQARSVSAQAYSPSAQVKAAAAHA